MQDFKVSDVAMNEVLEKLKSIQEDIDDAYDLLTQLMGRMDTDNLWKGEQKDTFMVYMQLMQEYHKCFSKKNGDNPVQQAIDAFEAHGKRIDDFYTGFEEYKELEGI